MEVKLPFTLLFFCSVEREGLYYLYLYLVGCIGFKLYRVVVEEAEAERVAQGRFRVKNEPPWRNFILLLLHALH